MSTGLCLSSFLGLWQRVGFIKPLTDLSPKDKFLKIPPTLGRVGRDLPRPRPMMPSAAVRLLGKQAQTAAAEP